MITIGNDATDPENRYELLVALRDAGILMTLAEVHDALRQLQESAKHPHTIANPDAMLAREGQLREALIAGPFVWVP